MDTHYVCVCTMQDVDLTHCRLRSLPPVIERLTRVEILTLRRNLLSDVTSVTSLSTLQELDLYDNELKDIPDMSKLTLLT